MTSSLHPIFSESSMNRMDHLRDRIHENIDGPDNRFVLFSDNGIVLRAADKKFLFSAADFANVPHDKTQAIFLGGKNQEYFFALSVPSDIGPAFEHVDLKEFTTQNLLPDAELGMIAQSASALKWHDNHKFCGCCGEKTNMAHGGWRRDCKPCGKQHFPRIDPVVIMLVTHKDHCLLGSGRDFKVHQRYSCLAGFMEPGETIEDAARRELFEEAGVKVRHVEYMFSQPWPFPSSLMIGVHMEAESMDMKMDEKELVGLKWVPKVDIEAVLKGATDRGFNLPPRVAIARNLLEVWVSPPERPLRLAQAADPNVPVRSNG